MSNGIGAVFGWSLSDRIARIFLMATLERRVRRRPLPKYRTVN